MFGVYGAEKIMKRPQIRKHGVDGQTVHQITTTEIPMPRLLMSRAM